MATKVNLRVQRYSRLRAYLTWNDIGATGYTLERKLSSDVWGNADTLVDNQSQFSHIDTDTRTRGADYDYRITPVYSGVPASPSDPVTTTVPNRLLMMFSDSSIAFGAEGRDHNTDSYNTAIFGNPIPGKTAVRVGADPMPDSPWLLSGQVAYRLKNVETVNHGQAGYYLNRWGRTDVEFNGHRPFFVDVLGQEAGVYTYYEGATGPETHLYPYTISDPLYAPGVPRYNTQLVTSNDWLFIQYGGNDILPPQWPAYRVSDVETALNMTINMWNTVGTPGNVIICTVPPLGNSFDYWDESYSWHPSQVSATDISEPGSPFPTQDIAYLNQRIAFVASNRGCHLLDANAICATVDGREWKDQIDGSDGDGTSTNSPWHILGDDNHFSQQLHNAMADQIATIMNTNDAGVDLDTDPPIVVASESDGATYGDEAVTLKLTASDNSDSSPSLTYRVDGGGWNTVEVEADIVIPQVNTTLVEYYATDESNNVSTTQSITINRDFAPTSSVNPPAGQYAPGTQLTITATDDIDPNPTIRYRWRY